MISSFLRIVIHPFPYICHFLSSQSSIIPVCSQIPMSTSYGYLNKIGEFAIRPRYLRACALTEGLAATGAVNSRVNASLRVCHEITGPLWRERRAGRCKAPRRRRCGDIVEERQRSRCPPAAAPLRAAARRLAGCVARSLHTTRYARRSRLASEPGGQQQSGPVIS